MKITSDAMEGILRLASEGRVRGLIPTLPDGIAESDFQSTVITLAKQLGWRYYHTQDSRKSVAGFPDLVLVRGIRLLFVELKSQNGKLDANQLNWLDDLKQTAAEVYVWRPGDFPVILAILSSATAPETAAAPL